MNPQWPGVIALIYELVPVGVILAVGLGSWVALLWLLSSGGPPHGEDRQGRRGR